MNKPVSILFAAVVTGAAGWLAITGGRLGNADHDQQILGRTAAEGQFSLDILSAAYRLDQVYLSMRGPRSNHAAIPLAPTLPADETLWLTGIETQVVDAATRQPVSNEFFCHSNLTLNPDSTTPAAHQRSLGSRLPADWRLFTLIPGRMSIRLPAGFGLPIKNSTLVDYYSMTLNQNPGQPARQVRLRTRIAGRYGDGATRALRPLFRQALYVYQQHVPTPEAAAALPATKRPAHEGERCAEQCRQPQVGQTASWSRPQPPAGGPVHPGATCCVANASPEGVTHQFGEQNTVHWMVPPGGHEYRTEVTQQLKFSGETRVHYVTGHLHPFGTSLRLVEMESGRTVCEILGESFEDRLGVAHMSQISSSEGIPLSPGKRYELIAEYDNRSNRPIDAMAILYLYAAAGPPDAGESLAKTVE